MPPESASNGGCSLIGIIISLSLDGAGFICVIVHQQNTARSARPKVRERLVEEAIIRDSDADSPGDYSERNSHYEAYISIFQHTTP
jgi:hypothetical protein